LDRQAELKNEIQGKRDDVISVLESLLSETTKSGDLDGALAIKNEIGRLKLSSKEQKAESPQPLPSNLSPLVDGKINLEWLKTVEFRKNNGRIYWFEEGVFQTRMEGNPTPQRLPDVKFSGDEVSFVASGNLQKLKVERRGREVKFFASADDESPEELSVQERKAANKTE